MMEHLTCKRCGYKQYDEGTIAELRKRYPDMEPHDISYLCGACMDNEEGDSMNAKLEEFRAQLERMREKGMGFMMVGTDDPGEAAEIMKIASEVMRPRPKKKVSNICYAVGKDYDETEFDTWDEDELARLWYEYCKENELICVKKKEIEE